MQYHSTATVVEFRDELMVVVRHWVLLHSFHLVQTKKAARELDDRGTPGMLVTLSFDWSENGDIPHRVQMQSE